MCVYVHVHVYVCACVCMHVFVRVTTNEKETMNWKDRKEGIWEGLEEREGEMM